MAIYAHFIYEMHNTGAGSPKCCCTPRTVCNSISSWANQWGAQLAYANGKELKGASLDQHRLKLKGASLDRHCPIHKLNQRHNRHKLEKLWNILSEHNGERITLSWIDSWAYMDTLQKCYYFDTCHGHITNLVMLCWCCIPLAALQGDLFGWIH